nr:MAG TPA: hypothetical protein [Caudoviricetes sp.]
MIYLFFLLGNVALSCGVFSREHAETRLNKWRANTLG